MMKELEISIIIPTYNNKVVLEETLKRIFDQDFNKERYEVILVDDGSFDETSGFLARLKPSLRFKYISHPKNLGRAKARNSGIKKAQGRIIVMVDDDVWVGREFIGAHYRAHISTNENIVVVGASPSAVNIPINFWNRYLCGRYSNILKRMKETADDLSYGFFRTGNVSMKKEVIDKVGLFDEGFTVYGGEDTDYGYRIKQEDFRLVHQNIIGQHFFDASFSSVLDKAYQKGISACFFVKKHPELYKDMQFHSVFHKDGQCGKNIIKKVMYFNGTILLNKCLVLLLSKFRSAEKLSVYLLGLLEWQYYAKTVKEYGKSIWA
ncbi:MAG: glycosyltransferase family 2 protein [bacterium]